MVLSLALGGRFPHFIEEEEEKKPKPYNLYRFVDLMENEQVYAKTGFAPYRIPQSEGNHNGWLSDKEEADSDSESTTIRGLEHCKMPPHRATGEDENPPDIATLLAQQLQNLLPEIVNQVTASVNANANNGNGNGANGGNGGNGNKGCTYKSFMSCYPKEYDGKGGITGGRVCPSNKMKRLKNEFWNHNMIGANHARYTDRFHELAKLVPHLVTPESVRIKRYMAGLAPEIRGMLKETQPATIQSAILKAGILTDEAVSNGTLSKGSEKRKSVDEPAKVGGSGRDVKKAKGGTNFVRPGHFARDCYSLAIPAAPVNAVDARPNQRASLGWLRNDRSGGNQVRGRAYNASMNAAEAAKDSSVVTEIADGNKVNVDRIIHGCKLELESSLFTIDFIPLGHGSFDVIVGMDWLSHNKAVIVCHEKVVEIPLVYGEILRVHGERVKKSTKALKNAKVDEPKISDIFVVREFVEVFPDDLKGLPPQRQVEFRIELIPRATPVVKSPYRLATSEMQELSEQLKELQDKVLSLPEGVEDFIVYYDASNQGLGCVLMQIDKDLNMHQRRWIELFSDYECEIRYHPGKANVVADALSRKERVKPRCVRAMVMTIQSGMKVLILAAQKEALEQENLPSERLNGLEQQMEKRDEGSLYFLDHIWVPLVGDVRITIMDEAHKSKYFVHPGADKMYYDLRDMYWCPGMKRDIAKYVSKCLACSKVKAKHQRPSGLLQQPKIPEWKWDKITMDFITKLPRSKNRHDTIWVIVDRLTKSANFLAIREDYSTERLARIYIDEIVARHGVPVSIISDRDGLFTSRCWQTVQKALGTRLDMSTTYHPKTDGQSKRTIQTLEDMLRACVIDFGGSWEGHLPLAEFSYNNSYHSSIRCAPFEALYRRKCRSPVLWAKIGESSLIGPELVQETIDKVVLIKEKLKAARDRVIRFGKKGKLAPRYVGPFEILKRVGPVAYRLRLPEELSGVHDTIHVSNLKKCLADASLHVPLDEIKVDKTLCFLEEPVEIMDREIKSLKRSRISLVKVHWNSKRGPEFTWECEDYMKSKYPQLFVERTDESAS
ncbi:putative reverse transcriptase domain-containing protein [Tanacetum coccineum]